MPRLPDADLMKTPEFQAAVRAGLGYLEAIGAAQAAHDQRHAARTQKHHEDRDAAARLAPAVARARREREKTERIAWEDQTLTRLQTMRGGGGKKGRRLPEVEAPKPPQSALAPWQPERAEVHLTAGHTGQLEWTIRPAPTNPHAPVWNRSHDENTVGRYIAAHTELSDDLEVARKQIQAKRK